MLDDYEKIQPLFYNSMRKIIKKNKLSHAYLIETNGIEYGFDLALSLAKTFLCPNNYTNLKKCSKCFICSNIEKGNYPDLKIIEADGKMIKKEQVVNLQDEFKVKPLYGKYLIYIIKDASLLNYSSANTILKFLEEPSDNIIAILLTNSVYNCIDTIASRCQILSLKNSKNEINKNIYIKTCPSDMNLDEYIKNENKKIIDFFYLLEKSNYAIIATNTPYLFREKTNILLNVGLYLYMEILNVSLDRNIVNLQDYEEIIKKIAEKLKTNDIIKKIDIINQFLENNKFNVNKDLFIDDFIIKFIGG